MNSPPRWERIGNQLESLGMKLFSIPAGKHDLTSATNWEELTRQHFEVERTCRAEVDVAASRLARQQPVPKDLSAAARYFLALRIGCAGDFLGMTFPPKAPDSPFNDIPDDWTDEQVIEWLLISLWDRRFDHWLKLDAISVMGPFPFYGLTPADPSAQE